MHIHQQIMLVDDMGEPDSELKETALSMMDFAFESGIFDYGEQVEDETPVSFRKQRDAFITRLDEIRKYRIEEAGSMLQDVYRQAVEAGYKPTQNILNLAVEKFKQNNGEVPDGMLGHALRKLGALLAGYYGMDSGFYDLEDNTAHIPTHEEIEKMGATLAPDKDIYLVELNFHY